MPSQPMIVHLGEQPSSGGVMSVSVLFAAGQGCVLATEALDAWSVGILAVEVFTGQPVFNIFQSKEEVRCSF